jgi:CO/xanthine dehydrogenase FAD-binding subunit
MKTFEYIKANTIEEAITLLDKYKEKAKIFAGGTDILVQMKQRKITPEYLIHKKVIS